jgi:DNA-binding GntR family transcriptional regulator
MSAPAGGEPAKGGRLPAANALDGVVDHRGGGRLEPLIQLDHTVDVPGEEAGAGHRRPRLLHRQVHPLDRPAEGGGKMPGHFGAGERFGSGKLIDASGVAGFGEYRGGDSGNVTQVDGTEGAVSADGNQSVALQILSQGLHVEIGTEVSPGDSGLFERLLGLAVGALEARGSGDVGSEQRELDDMRDAGAAGGVDEIDLPFRGALGGRGDQERAVNAIQGGGKRCRIGEIRGYGFHFLRQRAGFFRCVEHGANWYPPWGQGFEKFGAIMSGCAGDEDHGGFTYSLRWRGAGQDSFRGDFKVLNDQALAAEGPARRCKLRDGLGLEQRRVVAPEGEKVFLLAGAVVVEEVVQVARCGISQPLIGAVDAALVKKREGVAGSFPLVRQDARHAVFGNRRLVELADLKGAGIGVPLHGVAEEMRQQKQPLFGCDCVIDLDFGAVEVAGERIRDIARDDTDPIGTLQALLHACTVPFEGNHGLHCNAEILSRRGWGCYSEADRNTESRTMIEDIRAGEKPEPKERNGAGGKAGDPIVFAEMEPVTLKDRVIGVLKDAFFSGQLRPGDAIVERQLAAQMKIGTPAVREALIVLQEQGFVRRVANTRTSVTKFEPDEVRQLYTLRVEFEVLALEWARPLANKSDLDELERLVDALVAAGESGDRRKFLERDYAFHRRCWELSGNAYLAETLERLMAPMFAFVVLGSGAALTAAMAREHYDLVHALRHLRGPEFTEAVRKTFTKFAFRWIASMSHEDQP